MLLYKYKSLAQFDHVADILVNERLYCARYYDLNDPFEGLLVHAKRCEPWGLFPEGKMITNKSVDDIVGYEDYIAFRVCSLSSNCNDVRLWSHYGDGHRGVAIEIDVPACVNKFEKVSYRDSLYYFEDPRYADPSPIEVLTCKTSHWAYEAEYRIIQTDEFFPIPGYIRRVIMGINCRRRSEKILETLLPAGVSLCRADLNHEKVIIET